MRNFQLPGRSPVYAENGMAATSHPLATATALKTLQHGGNAVDAAIAASATLAVVEPHMSGIGGDCFAIVSLPDGSVFGLNGSGRSARNADAAWYRDNGFDTIPARGAHPVTVPGAIAAWEALVERFGTRSFDALFSDAITYAEKGYPVHDRVARDWALLVPEIKKVCGNRSSLLPDGRAPGAGSRHAWPGLGKTLRLIAGHGARAFYEGPVAASIADVIREAGGFLDEGDLAGISVDWVDPISARYNGHDVLEIPPNGQGITALILLNLLDALDMRQSDKDSVERYHLEIEAGRRAYSVRDHLVSDPATMTVPAAHLLSADYTAHLAAQVDRERRTDTIHLPPHPGSDTVYLTVVDRDRMAVSFINSLYSGFGSMLVAEDYGIVLQNRASCFNVVFNHPNEIGPSKRPMHTIIPAMVFKNGRPVISFGVMGGAYQPMGHAHVLANLIDYQMDPQAALDHARLFWNADGVLEVEAGISGKVRSGLVSKGHRLREAVSPWGGGQIIELNRPDGFLCGGSDHRKDGLVLGW